MSKLEQFKESIDDWIKYFKEESSYIKQAILEEQVVNCEAIDNIYHNYELIREIRGEIEELRKEIVALKLIQAIQLRR